MSMREETGWGRGGGREGEIEGRVDVHEMIDFKLFLLYKIVVLNSSFSSMSNVES